MPIRAILFDLDGTLLDTLADLGRSVNLVLEAHGCPGHPIEAYRYFVGEGVVRLFERTLPAGHRDAKVVGACVRDFERVYGENWNVQTRLYPGVADLLDALTERGVRMAVLSNKPDVFTRQCAEAYLAPWRFEAVFGQREGIPRKPDPTGAGEIVERLAVPPESFIYLGDTSTDMETARNAGMHGVGVAWGFRPVEELRSAGAEAILEHPTDLVELLNGWQFPMGRL
jgi:phosphoglycolate phosphatase